VAEGEKSLDQLIKLAMSVYYNQDLTSRRKKDKRHHDLSKGALPNWDLHPELATVVVKRGTSAENAQEGDSLGENPAPNWDPALSVKVATGGQSAPISR
jgi:hypothetical protein